MIGNIVAARPSWHPGWGLGAASEVDQLLTAAPGVAASYGTTAAVSAGTIVAGSALAVALPVVGIALSAIIGSLFAAHAKRVAGAQQENQVLNSLVPTVQQAIQQVFDALNNGTTDPSSASAALDQIQSSYWSAVSQVEHAPGQAGGAGSCSTKYGDSKGLIGAPCNKGCTASCCIGCGWVENWVDQGKKIIAAGGGTRTWPDIPSNSYGLQDFPGQTITYTPPAPGSIANVTSDLTSGNVSGLLSASIMGIPVWLIAAGLIAWKVL